MSSVVVDPSAPGGYRIEQDQAPAPAGPTADEFGSLSYAERVNLQARDPEGYRQLADAELDAAAKMLRS